MPRAAHVPTPLERLEQSGRDQGLRLVSAQERLEYTPILPSLTPSIMEPMWYPSGSSITASYANTTNTGYVQFIPPDGYRVTNTEFTHDTWTNNIIYNVNLTATATAGITYPNSFHTNVPIGGAPAYDPELARRRALKNERERKIARRRGTKLLVNLLNEMQKADYAKTGSFLVPAPSGRIYRLRKGKTAQELDPNTLKVKCSLCVHLTYGYIAEDSLIANMLAIETDEEAWRKVANISGEIHTHSQGNFADLVAA